MDGAVSPHGHGGAEGVGAFCRPGREGNNFRDRLSPFAKSDGFFDREFVKRIEGVLYTDGFDTTVEFVDTRFDLEEIRPSNQDRIRSEKR